MPRRPTDPTPETRQVADLKPHSAQVKLARPMGDAELRALAEKMEREGPDADPIHVLPDGPIVDGHQRWAVAKLLGWKTIAVIVRHDLVGDPDAAERAIVESNLLRKQADSIDRARYAMRLRELDGGVAFGDYGFGTPEYDRQLAELLGISLKHAKRLRKIITETPIEVQHAASAKRLKIEVAEKVAGLPEAAKAEIAAAIAAGGDPAEAVAAHVTPARRKAPRTSRQLQQDLTKVEQALARVEGREDAIRCDEPQVEQYERLADRLAGCGKLLKLAMRRQRARIREADKRMAKFLKKTSRELQALRPPKRRR